MPSRDDTGGANDNADLHLDGRQARGERMREVGDVEGRPAGLAGQREDQVCQGDLDGGGRQAGGLSDARDERVLGQGGQVHPRGDGQHDGVVKLDLKSNAASDVAAREERTERKNKEGDIASLKHCAGRRGERPCVRAPRTSVTWLEFFTTRPWPNTTSLTSSEDRTLPWPPAKLFNTVLFSRLELPITTLPVTLPAEEEEPMTLSEPVR